MKPLKYYVTLLFILTGCGSHTGTVSNAFSSSADCDVALLQEYQSKVYPFFRNTCVSCHIEGGQGLGTFASPKLESSFAAFSAAGVSKVAFMATNPQHKPPYTGTHNKAAVDLFSAQWNTAQGLYLECQSKSQNGGVNEALLTAPKAANRIYTGANATQTLTWELDLASDVDPSTNRAVPARISIDVKVLYQNNLAQGYIFTNPTLQLKDTMKPVVIEGLFFQINRQAISSQTTFTNVSRVVTGAQSVPLMNAQANTLISPLGTSDTFQLYIRRIALTSGAEDAPPPLTPILFANDPDTGSERLLKSREARVTILRDSGIVRWCLSESPTAPASTDQPCISSASGAGVVNGWITSRPLRYTVQAGDGLKKLYLWVADQNLKINAAPATVEITLDTTAPAPAAIDAIAVTDTQVGTMSLSHPNESQVAGWCVIEQNVIRSPPGRPELDDECWRWTDGGTKPTTIGFKGGGSRNVWVFVRDEAGNVSSASNVMAANNPFGAITFSQLTSTTGGPRAVFFNRCFTCHGTNTNPGYNKLKLFQFNAAAETAGTGMLVSRINNEISPMPNVNGGLMPLVERDLIRLWTMPEEGEEPLP
ncbi:MAG: hypothetical protein KF799_09325 [Bdellovibrionales bacterium]|nr:hypothetical protein [Bdellovibrionales bacterium]